MLTGYRPIGDVRISLDRLHPLSGALPTVMQIDILENATGEVGFLNEGWWGMNVEAGVAYNSCKLSRKATRLFRRKRD